MKSLWWLQMRYELNCDLLVECLECNVAGVGVNASQALESRCVLFLSSAGGM